MFYPKTLLNDKSKVDFSESSEMRTFQLEIHQMRAFQVQMHKTADFHSKLLVSWKLVTEGSQEKHEIYAFHTFQADRKTLTRKSNSLFFANFIYNLKL